MTAIEKWEQRLSKKSEIESAKIKQTIKLADAKAKIIALKNAVKNAKAEKRKHDGSVYGGYGYRKELLHSRAGEMRRRMTPAESKLWEELKNRRLDGIRFRNQVAFPPYYIADFASHIYKLVIEVDGSAHDGREEYDSRRTEFIKSPRISRYQISQRRSIGKYR